MEFETNIKVEILCKYWNGFEGSCKRGNINCKFIHSMLFSQRGNCKNWENNKVCKYGQNCNYFHVSSYPNGIPSLLNPEKGNKSILYHPISKNNKKSLIELKTGL